MIKNNINKNLSLNKRYTYPINYYNIGGILEKFQKWSDKVGNNIIGNNNFLGKFGVTSDNMGGIANTIGQSALGVINKNNNSTGVGNAIQTIGSLASNIPGVGGLLGAGVGLVGGLVNTMFGSNVNEEAVQQFRQQNNQQRNYVSAASTNQDLLSEFRGLTGLSNINKDDVGTEGWFSNKVTNLTKDLNAQRVLANLGAVTSLNTTAQNIDNNNDLLKQYNSSAYGGPINMNYTGIMSPFGNRFDTGGQLGIFTPQQQQELNVMLGRTPNGRPLEYGLKNVYPELLFMPSSTISNATAIPKLGLSTGKKMAVKGAKVLRNIEDALYDIGNKTDKTVYNTINTVRDKAIEKFPKHEKLIKDVSKGAKLTHKVAKENAYYPMFFYNDTTGNKKSFGGELIHGGIFSNGVQEINTGGTHEQNPYGGVQIGVDEQNIPNLVEEGEVIWNDYVFSNRLIVPKSIRQKYKLGNNKNLAFAEAAKKLQKESKERPNDPISKNGLNATLSDLANEQEKIRAMKPQTNNNKFEGGGPKHPEYLSKLEPLPGLGKYVEKYTKVPSPVNYINLNNVRKPFTIEDPINVFKEFTKGPSPISYISLNDVRKPSSIEDTTDGFKESTLRFAPARGHAIGVFSDAFSKPDYQASDELRNIELNPSLVSSTPIGNKLKYTPYDVERQINKLNANAGASRRNMLNTSGGNRAAAMAGLIGIDDNYNNAVGDTLRQALEYDDKRNYEIESFNRATDQYNSEMGLKAAMANAEVRNSIAKARYERDKAAALLGQQARDAYNARLSNNLNVFLEDLGNIGKERDFRSWADILAKRGVLRMNSRGEHVVKNGGKLYIKKKGGWQYA